MSQGALYVVATPIGNLDDFSPRAIEVCREVDWIAAEDTRHTGQLCARFNIKTQLIACHAHNEAKQAESLIEKLKAGESGGVVSDAGTPLIHDPGQRLVRMAHEQGIRVIPIPGACSPIAALSASGLLATPFIFQGFVPPKAKARIDWFMECAASPHTQIFFETPHRITESLKALVETFGEEREATLAREITKKFEQIVTSTLGDLAARIEDDIRAKGEFVLIVSGKTQASSDDVHVQHVLDTLLPHLSTKQAAACAAQITGASKNKIYEMALKQKDKE